jgi:hypothetical protein
MSVFYDELGAHGGLIEGSPIIQDRHREMEHEGRAKHWINHDYGSRTPTIEDDPEHIYYSVPEWMRISDNWEKKFK